MARWTLAFALVVAAAPTLRGQRDSPRLGLDRPEPVIANSSVPTTTMSGILTPGHRQELLHGGWPIAIHGRVQLWKRGALGIFGVESDFDWDVIVEYSPASKVYSLRR